MAVSRPFASSADTTPKQQTVEVLGDGIYALTAEGDPNVAAIEGDDFVVCIEATATPHTARRWLETLRRHTDKPVRYLVLTHYHAVRTLGAEAFGTDTIIAHEKTAALINERGEADRLSEQARMPRLFERPETIRGLTHPTMTFSERMTIQLGHGRGEVVLAYCGKGHTEGDLVVWLPRHRILFTGDLVESQAALYTGDAFHREWATSTLDTVAGFGADVLVGGRGAVAHGGAAVAASIEQTRRFLTTTIERTTTVREAGGSLKDAFAAVHRALAPAYGGWPIFDHCLPFNVSRLWDELSGVARPRIWTPERDREIWEELQG